MKCSSCQFYVKSRVYGNSCSCAGIKPCDRDRNKTKAAHANKVRKAHRERFGQDI